MNDSIRHVSFRRRLLLRVGIVVGIAFLLVQVSVWGGATVWLRMDAERFVREEAEEIASYVIRADGELKLDSYMWNEPHHLFSEARIDPFFVQIMDSQGEEIFATPNIALFTRGMYPRQLVGVQADEFSPFNELDRRFIGQAVLYFSVFPLRNRDGATLGFLQIARHVPDLQGTVQKVGLISASMLSILLVVLLVLLHIHTGRLLTPLHTIARTADSLDVDNLADRVPDLGFADRESVFLASAFNRLLDRLDASFHAMRRFTADASHQLQTPLTVVKGHVDVALRKERPSSYYQDTLQLIGEEVDGLSRMSRSLLLLSRLDRAEGYVEKNAVSLSEVVRQTIRDLNAIENDVRLTLDEDALVQGNEELCLILVQNLIDNALKYGKGNPIEVSVASTPQGVELTVQDQGIGISEADIKKLSDLFFRSQDVLDLGLPGTGLGLSLVDQIAAWHGASLHIASNLQSTPILTTLKVTFPANM